MTPCRYIYHKTFIYFFLNILTIVEFEKSKNHVFFSVEQGNYIDRHLDSVDSDPDPDQCLQSEDRLFRNKSRWDVETKHVASFMELMLKNTKRLEKMIVHLEDRYLKARGFKSLTRTLSRNSDVSIMFSTKPTRSDEWGIIGFKFD